MDILIKNLEIPKEKYIRVEIHHDGTFYVQKSGYYSFYVKSQDKAIELPPHGELKDCSVLLHYLAHMRGATEHDHALLKTFEKMIRECPTIVEATE